MITGKRILFFLALCFGFQSAVAQSNPELSLKDAIAIGLENNFNILIARNLQEVVEINAVPGQAGFLPVLNIVTGKTFSRANVEQQFLNDPQPRRLDNAGSNNFNVAAQLNWVVFDGLRMFTNLERLRELEAEGQENTKVAVENTVAAIANTFYLIALEEARREVLRRTIEISKQRLQISKDKYELGKASKLEFLAAQVDYNADSTALINQEVTIFIGKATLNELLGRDPAIDFRVAFEIDVTENLQLEALLNSLNVKNPQLLAAQRRANAAYLEIRATQAERYPTITLNSAYSYSKLNSDFGFLISNQNIGFNYGASAFVNVFNGGNLNRRIQTAKIQQMNADLSLEQLRLQLSADIKRAYVTHQKNITLMNLENFNRDIAKENEEIALERYRLGVSNALELREAQRNAVDAETRALVAAFNAKTSEIELLRLSGEILGYLEQ
jgi:outer membrane protein TolC